MERKYKDYLASIGIYGGIVERIENIMEQYRVIFPDKEVKDIFVTDYFSEDGNRNYESLWLFYDDVVCEAKNFITLDNFDCAKYSKDHLSLWRIEKKDFNLVEYNDNSRISLNANFGIDFEWEMKAARNNCIKLVQIIRERVAL